MRRDLQATDDILNKAINFYMNRRMIGYALTFSALNNYQCGPSKHIRHLSDGLARLDVQYTKVQGRTDTQDLMAI